MEAARLCVVDGKSQHGAKLERNPIDSDSSLLSRASCFPLVPFYPNKIRVVRSGAKKITFSLMPLATVLLLNLSPFVDMISRSL